MSMSDAYVLSQTPTSQHLFTPAREGVDAVLAQGVQFAFNASQCADLTQFLQAVKADPKRRRSYTAPDETYILDYDPERADLFCLQITRRSSGRVIAMGLSSAYRLLAALSGKHERLVREKGTNDG